MNDKDENRGVRWLKEYKRWRDVLDQADMDIIQNQLEKACEETPELYACFRMISLSVYDQIDRLDNEVSNVNYGSIFEIIHPKVIDTLLKAQILPMTDVEEWKRRYCKWANHIWWKKFLAGNLVEPPNC